MLLYFFIIAVRAASHAAKECLFTPKSSHVKFITIIIFLSMILEENFGCFLTHAPGSGQKLSGWDNILYYNLLL